MIILVGGLPGSGKTYFARRLAKRLSVPHLSSDTLRKALRAGGRYDIADKFLVYVELAKHVESRIKTGQSGIIVDATFSHRKMRELFLDVARKKSVPVKFIWIYADEQLIKERTRMPRVDSEADYNVYLKVREQAEAWDMPYLSLESTNTNIEDMLEKAVTYIFSNATA